MTKEELLQANRAIFFKAPHEPYFGDGWIDATNGTLYLLRREAIETLFDVDDIPPENTMGSRPVERRLFAGSMVVFAGIDLLGKFLAGSDGRWRVGKRFRRFCEKYMELSEAEAESLWKLRSALTHSFGIHVEDRSIVVHQTGNRDAVVWGDEKLWHVSVTNLYHGFVLAVAKYEEALARDKDLQERFSLMFGRYGTQFIAPGRGP